MKFTPRSEETRRFIIERSAEVFNTKGYAATSMSDLTEATKLSKGSIYGNFENKDEVAQAVLDYMITWRNTIIKEKLSRATTYKEKLLTYANLFTSKENHVFPKGGCPLLNAATEVDDTNEILRRKVAAVFNSTRKEIEALIQDGIEAKEFMPAVNAEKTALSIIALVEGGILLARTAQKPQYLDTVLETVKDLIQAMSPE